MIAFWRRRLFFAAKRDKTRDTAQLQAYALSMFISITVVKSMLRSATCYMALFDFSLIFFAESAGIWAKLQGKSRSRSSCSSSYIAINLSTAIDGETEVPVYKIELAKTFTQEVKRSRFRAAAAPVQDEEAAKAFLIFNLDTSANHNCWAELLSICRSGMRLILLP